MSAYAVRGGRLVDPDGHPFLSLGIDHADETSLQSLLLRSTKARPRIVVIHEQGRVWSVAHSSGSAVSRAPTEIESPAAAAQALHAANPDVELVAVFERDAVDDHFAAMGASWDPTKTSTPGSGASTTGSTTASTTPAATGPASSPTPARRHGSSACNGGSAHRSPTCAPRSSSTSPAARRWRSRCSTAARCGPRSSSGSSPWPRPATGTARSPSRSSAPTPTASSTTG